VTATSVANSAKSASAVVTVVGVLQHSVTLNWNASSTSRVSGYNAYRATQSGGPYTMINTALQPGMSYVDLTVEPGHTYYYVVTAVDSSGMESVYSNEAAAVVPLL
jgi:fibronectin type 3 domain-containing protein